MPFIQAGNIRLFYEISGAGPKLLFFNGTGGDLRIRPNMLDGPLPTHFELLVHDQRGLGQSSKPDGPYTMAHYADDAAHLLDAVGWDRCHVIGYSFGGMVAQEFVLRHPDRVNRLVLAATSPGGAGGASYPLHELAGLPRDAFVRQSIAIHDTRKTPEWQDTHPEQVAQMAALMVQAEERFSGEPRWAAGRAAQLEARRHHDTYDRLKFVTAPTLICAGRYDGSATPQAAEAMASQIPDSTVRVFDGGHLFIVEDRSAYQGIIDWLER